MPEERIQKVLAAAGVASRRAAEVLVATGRVRIDGVVATVGQKVDPVVSTISVNGTPVGVGVARAYVALHKPAGVTSTTRDRHAATTVLDLIPTALVPDGTRLYPVGRLDLDSEGLLLLTNDGEWAERVLHPRFGVEREYAVALAQPLSPEQARLLNAGIRVEEGVAKLSAPLRATTSIENRQLAGTLDPAPDPNYVWYRATLAQGWKRQLRRMFGAVEAPVLRLVRVRIGTVRLGDMRSGRSRHLKSPEIKGLVALGSSAPSRHSPGDARGSITPPAGQGAPSTARRPSSGRPPKGRPQGPRKPVGRKLAAGRMPAGTDPAPGPPTDYPTRISDETSNRRSAAARGGQRAGHRPTGPGTTSRHRET